MIKRILENKLFTELNDGGKIVILYGSRQVGKTTLIKRIIQNYPLPVLSVNADSDENLAVLSSRNSRRLKRFIGDHKVLFIDEAQRIPDIGINLKIIYEEIPDLKIIVSGSSALDLADRVSEPLTGRTWTYTLFPISFGEWREFKGLSAQPTPSDLEELLLFGSYPELLNLSGENRKIQYLNEIRRSYLYKDVLALGNVKYPEKLDQLVQMLAYQVGNLVSIQELAKSLQLNRDTVLNYIQLLEKGFVIFRLRGYSRNLRKEITKMSKIYFYDTGIRNVIINNFSPIHVRNDIGALWENFLITERKKWLSYSQKYANTYFWNTYTGAEVDYVEEKDGKLFGYEFKWNPHKYRESYRPWENAYKEAHYSCITPEQIGEWLPPIE